MKFFNKKEPWAYFLFRSFMVVGSILIVMYVFIDRYQIGVDDQTRKCIPGYTFYLIDKKDMEMIKGNVYAYKARGLSPIYNDGHIMIKFLRGMEGDQVEVTDTHDVMVNGEKLGDSLFHAKTLDRAASEFIGKGVITSGKYWMMGLTDTSFDSRYFGSIDKEQVIGRAYPIF